MSESCPKCGSAAANREGLYFDCGTYLHHHGGSLFESNACGIIASMRPIVQAAVELRECCADDEDGFRCWQTKLFDAVDEHRKAQQSVCRCNAIDDQLHFRNCPERKAQQ